jgi:hypothetical protein
MRNVPTKRCGEKEAPGVHEDGMDLVDTVDRMDRVICAENKFCI